MADNPNEDALRKYRQDPQPRSLVRKLAEVMGEIERVPKSGHNSFHNYDFATEADIVAAVRTGMAKRHLMLIPSVQHKEFQAIATKNGNDRLCTLTVRFTIVDGDSGESEFFDVIGEGQDRGDKATYKAMTGATKYALLKLFLIPTGDDPEHEEPAPPPRRAPPLKSEKAAAPPSAAPKDDSPRAQVRARMSRLWNQAVAARVDSEQFTAWVRTTLGRSSQVELKTETLTTYEVDKLEKAFSSLVRDDNADEEPELPGVNG